MKQYAVLYRYIFTNIFKEVFKVFVMAIGGCEVLKDVKFLRLHQYLGKFASELITLLIPIAKPDVTGFALSVKIA